MTGVLANGCMVPRVMCITGKFSRTASESKTVFRHPHGIQMSCEGDGMDDTKPGS